MKHTKRERTKEIFKKMRYCLEGKRKEEINRNSRNILSIFDERHTLKSDREQHHKWKKSKGQTQEAYELIHKYLAHQFFMCKMKNFI